MRPCARAYEKWLAWQEPERRFIAGRLRASSVTLIFHFPKMTSMLMMIAMFV
jgi:hypothetical protein